MKPVISIILPVYNGEEFLAGAIDSILKQTYSNFELIIVNDHSTDDSLHIIQEYANKDKRIKFINNSKNLKLPASLNIGHNASSGDYFTWTSHDNLLKDYFLEVLLEEIIKKNVDVVYSDYDIIDARGRLKRTHSPASISHILFGNCIGASFLYKKEVYEKLKGYDESLFLVEDYDFWLRASTEFKIEKINRNIYQYRLQEKSLTHKIQTSKETTQLHQKALSASILQIAQKFEWNQETLNLILASHTNVECSVLEYLKNKKRIKNDIFKFLEKQNLRKESYYGLYLYLRQSFKKVETQQNIQSFFQILINDKNILFHKSFSKKETVRLISNCLF